MPLSHAGERGPRNGRSPFADSSVMARLLRRMTFRARSLRRSATAAEQALWRALRNRSLGYRFRRQQPLGPYVVDFFCAEARLVIEIDGPCHIRRRRDDRRRDAWLLTSFAGEWFTMQLSSRITASKLLTSSSTSLTSNSLVS